MSTLVLDPPPSGLIWVPGDVHGIRRDLRACDTFLETLVKHPGSDVVFQGDTWDANALSSHLHGRADHVAEIAEEAASINPFLKDVASQARSMVVLAGNHCNRANRVAAESRLDDRRTWWEILQADCIAELDNVTFLEYGDRVNCASVVIEHGDGKRGMGSETLKRLYNDHHGMQLMVGHSHQPLEWEVKTVTPRGRPVIYGAYNVGHLSDIDKTQVYAKDCGVRWGLAFGVARIRGDGYANVAVKRIERIDGKAVIL